MSSEDRETVEVGHLDLLNHPEIELVPTSRLYPAGHHARTHDDNQIGKLAASIQSFGFINPIITDSRYEIVAGNARWQAAQKLGMDTVPVLRVMFMSEGDKKTYKIADNRLAELAGWDFEVLALEFESIMDFGISPEITGFDTVDIDQIMIGEDSENDPADAIDPEPRRNAPPVSQLGDLWEADGHRIFCGDATHYDSFGHLLGNERVQMVITDPPYNVKIKGFVSGLGSIQHGEFAMASGEMSEGEFKRFLRDVCKNMAAASEDGAIHFIFMDWRHIEHLMMIARDVYEEIKNLIVWRKSNAGMGSFYRSQHELILATKVGRASHINNFGLGERRYRTNVWTYPGVNTFRKSRMDDLACHPTVKPTQMVADAILDCSKRGGIVLDAFLGSGTTLLAAEQTGRQARGIELDPWYVDTAIRRWQTMTGEKAHLAHTGQSFDDVSANRSDSLRLLPPPGRSEA